MENKFKRETKKEINARIIKLPKEYQVTFYEIMKYLYSFSANEDEILPILFDILDMFDTGVLEGNKIHDIVGNNIVKFCDGLLEVTSGNSWFLKMKESINEEILKKIEKNSEK